MLKNIAVTKL